MIKIGTNGTAEVTVWTLCITEEEFLRLDAVIENLISGNHFCFSVTKKMNMVTNGIFGITITFGNWATNMNSIKKIYTGLGKNQTVRKIMTNNKNPSIRIDIKSVLFTLRIQYE